LTTADSRPPEALPRGILASILLGASGAGCAWLLTGVLPALTTSNARLDQLSALCFGAATGAAVVAGCDYRRRRGLLAGAVAGALLGGVGGLAGVTPFALATGAVSVRLFLLERVAAWLFAAVGVALATRVWASDLRRKRLGETALIAAVGGAISGVIFTLPGATDAWQGVAALWLGATVGLAVAGPDLWGAIGVLAVMPRKGHRWSPWRLREWPLHDGVSLMLGEAQIACLDGRIVLYPPAGGMQADGRTVRRPRFLAASTQIAVGHQRYHMQLLRER
jgi:hypothetical protein